MKNNFAKICVAIAAGILFMAAVAPCYGDMTVPDNTAITRNLTVEQRPIANLSIPAGDLKVSAWVDHQDNRYRAGDKVVLSVKANQDCYLTILDVGTSGKVHIIFPNQYQQVNKVKAGQVVNVPGSNAKFDYMVGGPAGSELIKVIATTSSTPLIDDAVTSPAGPYKAVNKPAKVLAKDLAVVMRPNGGNKFAEYNKVIKIVDAASANSVPVKSQAPTASQPPVNQAAAEGATPPPAAPAAATTGTFAGSAVQLVPDAPVPFNVHLRTEKSVYKIGKKVKIMVTPEKDCTLTLIDVGTSGKVYILFPNRYQQNNRLKAGQTVVIPADTAPVDYQLGGPEGVEALIAICRTDNQPVFNGTYDFKKNIYQPWGNSSVIAKDLAVVLREPSANIAHTATTFLVVK